MKNLGCGLVVIGLLAVVTSIMLFGGTIVRALEARKVHSIPITVNKQTTTDVIEIDPEKFCQVALNVSFQTTSIQEEKKFDQVERVPRYRFPVRYKVLDEKGKVIFSEATNAAWDQGTRSTSHVQVDNTQATGTIESSFGKFKVPPPGRIKVQIEVQNDRDYQAEARTLELNVYDNVSKHTRSVLGAGAACCLGPGLIVIGVVLFIVGLAGGKSGDPTDANPS